MTTLPDPEPSPPAGAGPAAGPTGPAAPVLAAGPRRWKVGLALTAIFLCGVLVGGMGALRFVQEGARRHVDPARWSATVLDQLGRRLHLTPAQRERIAPLVRAGAEEARAARRRAFGETRGIIDRTHNQIAAELSETQRPELERFIAERRQRARRWFRPPGPGEGPPPPPARP